MVNNTEIDDVLVFLDTNILLFLYKCSFNTSQNIISLLKKMRDQIVIPYQVYEEYLKHNKSEQGKLEKKYENFTKTLSEVIEKANKDIANHLTEGKKYHFPNCVELETDIKNTLTDTNSIILEYANKIVNEKKHKNIQISAVEDIVTYWKEHKRITEKPSITTILSLIQEGELRYRYKLPPGYMDECKDEKIQKGKIGDCFESRISKFGDFFIWKEIIRIGKENIDKGVIFVTNDTKEDWWDENRHCMRNELIQEYSSIVGNSNIEFLNIEDFYDKYANTFKILDLHTSFELYAHRDVCEIIHNRYENNICKFSKEAIDKIDFYSIVDAGTNIERSEYEILGYHVQPPSVRFDDEDETIVYDFVILIEVENIHILKKDLSTTDKWICDLCIKPVINATISRDMLDKDEVYLEIKGIDCSNVIRKEITEIEEEARSDAEADFADMIEAM